jgi:ATP phosphoribosyltransferase
MRIYKFGIPKGNLNKPLPEDDNDSNHYRGHTAELLKLAGFKMRNYKPGKEGKERRKDGRAEKIVAEGEADLDFYCMKPGELLYHMERGGLDMAIIGQDLIEEAHAGIWHEKDWTNGLDNQYCMNPKELKFYLEKPCIKDTGFLRWLTLIGKSDIAKEQEKRPWMLVSEWVKDVLLKSKDSNEEKGYSLVERMKLREKYKKREWPDESPFGRIDLGFGRVDIRFGMPQELDEDFVLDKRKRIDGKDAVSRINIASTYPNLTYREIIQYVNRYFMMIDLRRPGIHIRQPRELLVRKFCPDVKGGRLYDNSLEESYKACSRNSSERELLSNLIKISYSPRSTETSIEMGAADLVVDCVASGDSFRENNLAAIGEPIMKDSTTALCMRVDFTKRMSEIADVLKKAAREYGKTNKDSIYYQGRQK